MSDATMLLIGVNRAANDPRPIHRNTCQLFTIFFSSEILGKGLLPDTGKPMPQKSNVKKKIRLFLTSVELATRLHRAGPLRLPKGYGRLYRLYH
jgi:hypothetical protein